MSHLRIVGSEPQKPKRRKGDLVVLGLFSPDEHKRGIQALRNLKDAFGSWPCLANAMGVSANTLHGANRKKRITAVLLYAASKASGLSIADLLSDPAPANRCKFCGRVGYARAV